MEDEVRYYCRVLLGVPDVLIARFCELVYLAPPSGMASLSAGEIVELQTVEHAIQEHKEMVRRRQHMQASLSPALPPELPPALPPGLSTELPTVSTGLSPGRSPALFRALTSKPRRLTSFS